MLENSILRAKRFLHITFLALACCFGNSKAEDAGSKLGIENSQVYQISISTFPKRFDAIKTTDTSQITLIVDYLNSIKPVNVKVSPQHALGASYSVKMQFKNKSARTFSLSGNSWLIERNRFIYEMKYDDAIKFDKIVAAIIERNLEKSQVPSVEGTVASITSLPSGRHTFCVIKDKENKSHNTNLKKASIVDATGSGWMILHEKDDVKVFYNQENKSHGAVISAGMVIIKRTF
jgi:hypothetical protein